MGYTTDFEGRFELNKPLDDELYEYLVKFNNTRRMARNLPSKFGFEGEFYVDGSGWMGQGNDGNVTNHNAPPGTQPGLWCQWRPTKDRNGIEWDEGEKFYKYTEWLEYIVVNFLKPNGYILNGQVSWYGENRDDIGYLIVIDNDVKACHGEVVMKGSND